jgi:hypothetical protein
MISDKLAFTPRRYYLHTISLISATQYAIRIYC